MKKRKPKSRLTRVDLDTVLKLQREYDYIKSEVLRTFELSIEFADGNVKAADYKIRSDNEFIHHIILRMQLMANRIKELEEKISNDPDNRTIPASAHG